MTPIQYVADIASHYGFSRCITLYCITLCYFALFPKQELLGSSPQKKNERAWRDGWHAARELGGMRLWSCGPAEFGWVARGFGAWAPRSLDGWHAALPAVLDGTQHAAQELGARGVWMGGTRLWRYARGSGAGRPRFRSNARHAALSWGSAEFGWVTLEPARTVWVGSTRLRSWGARHGVWLGAGQQHAAQKLRAGGPQSLDGWHAAQELGELEAHGVWILDGWHAALEQGARGFDACAGHF